jgi:hypothetical protein
MVVIAASLAHLINKLPNSLRPGLSWSSPYPFVLVAFFATTIVIATGVVADTIAVAITIAIAIAVAVRVQLQLWLQLLEVIEV